MRKLWPMAMMAWIATGTTWAYEQTNAKVTLVQSTYMPTSIAFTADTGTPSCPAGTWLYWRNANIDNNKATYATLLGALTSGLPISYSVDDGDTGCSVLFLDLVSS